MKKNTWAIVAGVSALLAIVLRYLLKIYYPAYAFGAIAIIAAFWHFRKNLPVLVAMLTGSALFLRFAVRGYAWWGYVLLFVAALLVLHRVLPVALWRIVVVLTCVGLAWFCYVESFIIRNAVTDKDDGRDYVIVLGAAVHQDQPSLTLIRRLQGAADYLERHPGSVAIVSGGMGPGETITEAQAMYDWLVNEGFDPARIIQEPKATSTQENLENSFAIIRARGDEPAGKVAIVSSAYHLYRAKTMARNLGVPDAAGVAAPWGYFFVMLNYFIREAFGVTHLWVFGR